MVASLAFMTTFMAAGISPAFHAMAEDLHVTVKAATYLTSSQICIHGIAPLVWKPIANHYGRRPVWIISALGSLAFNIGCAESHTYGAQQVCRCLTTFFISTANGIGSAVVTETYFLKERAEKMVRRGALDNSHHFSASFNNSRGNRATGLLESH